MNTGLNITGVQINDVEKYNKKCDVIKKLIKSTYPSIDISFEQINRLDLVFMNIENIIKIALLPDETWNQIKSNIDDKLNTIGFNQLSKPYAIEYCELCSRNIRAKASCNFCHKICCIECYIDSFKKGKGIIKCGFCSKKFGVKCADEYIELMIDDIRTNAFGNLK